MAALVLATSSARSDRLPAPNRGKQLFLLIETRDGGTEVAAMDDPRRWLVEKWNINNPTYDFLRAESKTTETGSELSIARYFMGADDIPREERAQLTFPYTEQRCYRLEYGTITGFYRNSVDDIDEREFFPDR
jgi:hypothetical protein